MSLNYVHETNILHIAITGMLIDDIRNINEIMNFIICEYILYSQASMSMTPQLPRRSRTRLG